MAKILESMHYMPAAMGGTFATFTVVWDGGFKKFYSEQDALAFATAQKG